MSQGFGGSFEAGGILDAAARIFGDGRGPLRALAISRGSGAPGAAAGAPRLLTGELQALIDLAAERGGGTIALGPGDWPSGALVLKDRVGLRLEQGARLIASPDPADFPPRLQRWEGRTVMAHSPLLGAYGARGVRVTGPGEIIGSGKPWWDAFRSGALSYPRPRLLGFADCQDILLEGFTASESPSWTIHPARCRRVEIRGVRIDNPADSPNTDGIDPDSCVDVRIIGCSISAGDDCIAVKSGVEAEPAELRPASEMIAVSACVFESGHGGVVLGSEMSGGIRDVVVSGCVFRGTDRGIRVKTRRGRGGAVEGAVFSALTMRDVAVPVSVNCRYGCGAWGDPTVSDPSPRPVGPGTPAVSGLRFSSVEARGATICAAFVYGIPESPARGLSFSDCLFALAPGAGEPAAPDMGDGFPLLDRGGFYARHASGLSLRGVRIEGQSGPDFDLGGVEADRG